MGKNRQATITRDMLAIPRTEHLFPFLANGNELAYFHLVQRLDEQAFWNEIAELVVEHRPDDITTLVRKRFGAGEKRYQWETVQRHGWREQTSSPYTVLEPKQQQRVIDDIIARERESLEGAEHLLNRPKVVMMFMGGYLEEKPLTRRTQGHLMVAGDIVKHGREHWKEVGRRRAKGGFTTRWLVKDGHKGKEGSYNHNGFAKRVFIDLESERKRLQFVYEKLLRIQPSCIAAITASYVLFNTEFYIQHYQSELAVVRGEFTACFSKRGIPTVSLQRRKKLLGQEANLEMLLENQQTAHAVFEEKVLTYWRQETPRREWALLSTKRVNKKRVPNEKFRQAIIQLSSSAWQTFYAGDYLGAMTLFVALGKLGSSEALSQVNGSLCSELQGCIGYKGDYAIAAGHLPDLLRCLEASGMKPYLADEKTVRFHKNEDARVELLPDAIGSIHYLRVRFFGIPSVSIKPVKDDSLAARIDRALYHGRP